MQNACQNCQRVSHRYFLALEKCHRERERERERECFAMCIHTWRDIRSFHRSCCYTHVCFNNFARNSKPFAIPPALPNLQTEKPNYCFSDGCLRKTKFTFPWQEWAYFLIFNFLGGPSLLHSYSRSTQPNRKPTK